MDELVEGLGRPLSVRGGKNLKALENSCLVSENEAIKWQEPRAGFAASLDLQPEFSLAGCRCEELFYQGECFGFLTVGGDHNLR